MAVKRPFAGLIGGEQHRVGLTRRHRNDVLIWQAISGHAVFKLYEHAVQMHGVRHHGVVHEGEPEALAVGLVDEVVTPKKDKAKK